MLQLRLLGAPSIRDDAGEIRLPSQKAQALLFYLAAEAERSFARGQLITLLWEESSEREGRNSLSTVLTRLRQALPDVPVRAEGDTLAWRPASASWIDLHDARRLLCHPQNALDDPAEPIQRRIERLQSAVDLYRGAFLEGFSLRDSESYTEWLQLERERWQQRWLDALARLVESYTSEGAWAQAIDYARRGIAANPLQERFHRALMRLHYSTGDRSAALGQYRHCREVLGHELGIEPDTETIKLHQAIIEGALERSALPAHAAEAHALGAQPQMPEGGRGGDAIHVFGSQSLLPTTRPAAASQPPHPSSPRRHSFVGRSEALVLFNHALAQQEPPFAVLHIAGPAGIGKSALLNEFARQCASADALALRLDGRDMPPTSQGFLGALRDLTSAADPLAALPDRIVLLVDSYERLAPIDGWLREDFLPQLPYWAIVVLADNNPRADDWQIDPGWQAIGQSIQLGDLSAADSAAYLQQRHTPATHHEAALHLAHGHPLTLALAAEVLLQRPDSSLDQIFAPDALRGLVERFLVGMPSDAHRAALEACCQVRVMSEPLLAAMLGRTDTQALFAWLQQLSFVATGPGGIFPHELVRAAVAADLQRHNLRWYHELHRRARRFYMSAFAHSQSHARHDTLLDTIFLHENLLVQQALEGSAPVGWRHNQHNSPASRRTARPCHTVRRTRASLGLFPGKPVTP
jgi:DNA-binding SARP family transcriptional activator